MAKKGKDTRHFLLLLLLPAVGCRRFRNYGPLFRVPNAIKGSVFKLKPGSSRSEYSFAYFTYPVPTLDPTKSEWVDYAAVRA